MAACNRCVLGEPYVNNALKAGRAYVKFHLLFAVSAVIASVNKSPGSVIAPSATLKAAEQPGDILPLAATCLENAMQQALQNAQVGGKVFSPPNWLKSIASVHLGGHLKTGHSWTVQNRPSGAWRPRRVSLPRSGHPLRKSVWILVRQLRGPHLRTWAWWSRRSSSAVTAAVSPRSLPQSSTGRFEVSSVEARS